MNNKGLGTLPYKYVVFDIDGTLIAKARTADESEDFAAIIALMDEKYIRAFQALANLCEERGVKLIIATGRPPEFALLVNDLLFAGRAHAVICQQGWQTVMNGERRAHPLGGESWLLRVAEVHNKMLSIRLPDDFVYNNGYSCGIVSKDEKRLQDYRQLMLPLSKDGLAFRIMSETVYVTHDAVTKLTALEGAIGNGKYAFIGDSPNDYEAMVGPNCVRIGLPANTSDALRDLLSREHTDDRGRFFPMDNTWHSHRHNENLAGTTELLRRMLQRDLGITC